MADEIKVAQTPIQRNELDVAMELTNLYFNGKPISTIEEVQMTYTKMFAIAYGASHAATMGGDLRKFLPEEFKR
jgi:hypothetical protein